MLTDIRRFIDFLPSSNIQSAPIRETFDKISRSELRFGLPDTENSNTPYDIKEFIIKSVIEGDFFEIQSSFAKNIVVGFGRIDGYTVGFVGNQPLNLAGVLDSDASRKAVNLFDFVVIFYSNSNFC